MLYESCYYLRSLRVVRLINWCLLACCLCVGSLFFYLSTDSFPIFPAKAYPRKSVVKPALLQTRVFEKSPLALQIQRDSFPFPSLKDEICYLGHNTRPDADVNDTVAHLWFKGKKQIHCCHVNEPIFLSYENGLLSASNTQTPLMLSLSTDGLGLKMEAMLNIENQCRSFKWQAQPQRVPQRLSPDSSLAKACEKLKRLKVYGPDRFIELYGGAEFEAQKCALRVEEDGLLNFLNDGDCWIWKDKWCKAGNFSSSQSYPLARFSTQGQRVEVTLWDVDGVNQMQFSPQLVNIGPRALKAQDIFKQIRKRTHSSVSCRIDGKARIMRKGDWLVKQGDSWHTLRSIEEIDACVQGRISGDLFVFDELEKRSSDWVMRGRLFDQRRTQVQEVALPFSVRNHKPQPEPVDVNDFDHIDDDDDFLNSLMNGDDDD